LIRADATPMNGVGALWLSVVERAIKDALGETGISHARRCGRRGVPCQACAERQRALDWLAGRRPGFKAVCELVGVEPGLARARCLAIVEGTQPMPRQRGAR
jgi:hypothetical protein